MSDLKEFLEKEGDCCYLKDDYDKLAKLQPEDLFYSPALVIQKKKLGLFFWERGGKQFVEYIRDVRFWDKSVLFSYDFLMEKVDYFLKGNSDNENWSDDEHLQDFLDCLACLGEDKVKELIKKEKDGVKK